MRKGLNTQSGQRRSCFPCFRCQLEGVSPPVTRSDLDFDAGAASGVLFDVPGSRSVCGVFRVEPLCVGAGGGRGCALACVWGRGVRGRVGG